MLLPKLPQTTKGTLGLYRVPFLGSLPEFSILPLSPPDFQRNYNHCNVCHTLTLPGISILHVLGHIYFTDFRSQITGLPSNRPPSCPDPLRCQNPCLGPPIPTPNTLGVVPGIRSILFPPVDQQLFEGRAWGLLDHCCPQHSEAVHTKPSYKLKE